MTKCADICPLRTTDPKNVIPAFFAQTTAQIWNIPISEVGGDQDCINVQKTYEKWAGIQVCGIDADKQ